MIILPAIDIKDGECVRLVKGDFATVHKVAESHIATAKKFKKDGAVWLHMVDLDGALEGKRVNENIFVETAQKSGLRIQLGGGIRDIKTIEHYVNAGIERLIIGSAAVSSPSLVEDAVKNFGDRIAVGIDAKNEMVATNGWLDTSDMHYIELAKRMEDIGVKHIIFTDISKDGTLRGPATQQLYKLQETVSSNIIASGGIANLENIVELAKNNIYGAICGKSIYAGTLKLKDAISVGGEQDVS